MTLILCGFQGCGKTTIGQEVAELLGWPFVDTDALIEAQCGKTPREIVLEQGEGAFRALERTVVAQLRVMQPTVIAVGGGTVVDPVNVGRLKTLGELIWIKVCRELARERFTRPVDFEKLWDERTPIYQQVADEIIELE